MEALDNITNRRKDCRNRCGFSTWYSSGHGEIKKASLINISTTGARIACDEELLVGAQLSLLSLHSGRLREIKVIVRWTEVLPGGFRSVVGLEIVNIETRSVAA